MRLMVTGGGTGGGIYPALAVVGELLEDASWGTDLGDVAWVGMAGGLEERVVTGQGIAFYALPSGALRDRGPREALGNLARVAQGVVQAKRTLRGFRPDVVLATGGYVSAPLVLAAWPRVPTLLYLPDMEPGIAVRYLTPLARRVAVSFEPVLKHFPRGKAFVSGYPVRRELFVLDRVAARERLGLGADRPVLLVFGGSQGARTLNQAIARSLDAFLGVADLVHVCGRADYAALMSRREELSPALAERYRLHAYLDELPSVMAAADLAVARAGAATLAEFPAVGLPAVLVPLPISGQHQLPNARMLEACGAAVVVPDEEAEARLLPTVTALLADDHRRAAMAGAMRALATPGAARAIAQELCALARGGTR